jgi:type IV pilus assembly protein PilF
LREKTPDDLALGQKESSGDLYVKLAIEYLRLGQVETALFNANKALKEDASNIQAHIVAGGIYYKLGQEKLADEHYRKAIALDPKNAYALHAYGSYLCDRRKFAEAESHYRKALANPLYSTPWVAMTNMGTCARRAGKSAQAERHFQDALRANPKFGPAMVAMADLEYARGNHKSARGYLDRYLEVTQPTAQALLLAVRVERKLGARKRANTYAQLLRKSYPGSKEALQL